MTGRRGEATPIRRDAASSAVGQGIASEPLRCGRTLALYFLISAAVVTALILLLDQLDWAVIAAILFAYPAILTWLLVIRPFRRSLGSYSRWRDVMPCYLTVQDRDLRIIDSNEAFRRDYGDRLGELCYEVYKGRDEPCPECAVRDVLRDGKVRSHRSTVTKKNGEVAHIISTAAPQLDSRGEVVAAVEMFTDITEIEALREKLGKTRRRYQRLFNSLPAHASVLSRRLRLIDANELYRRDFGDRADVHCYEICKGRTSPCPDCLVAKTFEDGEIHVSEETLTTRDGRTLNMVVHSMPVLDDDGSIRSVMEVFTDITAIKRLESKLALVGRAVAGIAHRTKNILMGLEGGIFVIDTALEEDDQEQLSEGWRMVQTNVARVSRIVRDLLFCSKERKPALADDVDPAEIARNVHALYHERLEKEGIEFVLDLPEERRTGRFDPDGLHSMLCNLVANAIDACRFDQDESKEGHRIVLRARAGGAGQTVFEVEDSGPGIPEELSDKVFRDFFSTKGTEGTGIGLLVVQKVAEDHGGAVTFRTETGKGTTFRIEIPPPPAEASSGVAAGAGIQ